MLVNHEFFNNRLTVSYIDDTGQIKLKNYPFRPEQLKVTSNDNPNAEKNIKSWDGKKLIKSETRYPNRYTIYDFIDTLPKEEVEMLFAYNEPKIYYMDIETEIVDGFPEASEAASRVLANSIVVDDKGLMTGLKPLSEKDVQDIEDWVNEYFKKFNPKFKLKYTHYASEKQLMSALFNDLIPRMPVITGWNVIGYDWLYLTNRARLLGINPNVSSPTGKLIKPWDSKNKRPKEEELPLHRIIVDYMDLYKKWDTKVKIKESDKLDYVAEQILGLKKIEYDGSLQDLYEADFKKYMYYNIVDVILVKYIHEHTKYIDILFAISVLSNICVTDAFSTIRTTEGILRRPFRDKLNIHLVKSYDDVIDVDDEVDEELLGGFVKVPIIGMSVWTSVLDFASLYPTTMRQFNIAPEAYKGQRVSKEKCIYQGNLVDILPNDIICLNGAVFKNEDSVTKEVLTNIFIDRKKYKNMSFAARDERIKLEEELKKLMEAA